MATDHEQSDEDPEKKLVMYSRVSATGQNAQDAQVDLQIRQIERFVEKVGASVVAWYVDAGSNDSDT